VLIDTPPKVDADLRPSLREADVVLVPVASSHVDLWATEGVLDLARREGKRAVIVMNRTRIGTRLGAEVEEAATALEADVAESGLANRVIYAETLGRGQSAQEAGRGAVRAEVQALADEVVRFLET
jgi:chromosome partitioning protein